MLKCKGTMLNNDINISRMVVYIQQVEDEKKKQAKIREGEVKSSSIQSRVGISKMVGKIEIVDQ